MPNAVLGADKEGCLSWQALAGEVQKTKNTEARQMSGNDKTGNAE